MIKKVLVLYYSQSGQLGDIVASLTTPLSAAGHSVELVNIMPVTPYTFPWSGKSFFAVMPDCVLGVTTALQPFELRETTYDLIIFGYQAWFLSPSIPANSILNHTQLKPHFASTPVITITGARNMWLSAMEVIRKTFKDAGTRHAGNIVLVDKHHNLVSFVTIQYWMFTGKRDRYLNVFPRPGVSEQDVANCQIFGSTIEKYLANGQYSGLQEALLAQKAVVVKYSLMFIEGKAKRIFGIWAGIISKRKNKAPWLAAYKYYLIIALLLVAPILLTIDAIFFRPFLQKRIKRQKQYFSGVNQ